MDTKYVMLDKEGLPHIRFGSDGTFFNTITNRQIQTTKNYIQIKANASLKPYFFNVRRLIEQKFGNEFTQIPASDKVNLYFMGYPNHSVTRDGRIWSHVQTRWVKQNKCYSGYLMAGINKPNSGKQDNVIVHRLVAFAFKPNPSKLPDVDHINGNKEDNRVENLEWVSTEENLRRARVNGQRKMSVSDAQIHQICRMIKEGKRNCEISKITGASMDVIHHIKYQGCHSRIAKLYGIEQTKPNYKSHADYKLEYIKRKEKFLRNKNRPM